MKGTAWKWFVSNFNFAFVMSVNNPRKGDPSIHSFVVKQIIVSTLQVVTDSWQTVLSSVHIDIFCTVQKWRKKIGNPAQAKICCILVSVTLLMSLFFWTNWQMMVNYKLLVFGLLFLLIFEYTNLIFDKISNQRNSNSKIIVHPLNW